MTTVGLSFDITSRIVEHLGVRRDEPSLDHLRTLIEGYACTVPWESASRIARRRSRATESECANWPETFWRDTIARGTGGTCFESNYAFLALLRALGYDGSLTVNDMEEMRACHSAIVVRLDAVRALVDVGIPLHAAIPIEPAKPMSAGSHFHTYVVSPLEPGVYRVERDRHPKPYIYTLYDRVVDDAAYRDTLVQDYDTERGLFLDRVIVSKVVDGIQRRFCSSDRPWSIECFSDGTRESKLLGADPVGEVAASFGIDPDVILAAWPTDPPT